MQRVAGASHGNVEEAAFFLLVQRLVVGFGDGIGVAQLAGESDQSLPVGTGERIRIGAQNEDVGKLQALGAVHGHEANGVLAVVGFQRNHAAGFAE